MRVCRVIYNASAVFTNGLLVKIIKTLKFLLSPTLWIRLCWPRIKFLLSPTSCMSLCCPNTYHWVSATPYFMPKHVLLPVKSLRCVLFCYWPCGVSYPLTEFVVYPILSVTFWCVLSYYWPCGVSYLIIDLVMSPILLLNLWCFLSYYCPCDVSYKWCIL